VKIGPANNTTPLIGNKQEAANKANRGQEKDKAREDQLNISSEARELLANYKVLSKVSVEVENISERKLNLIRLKISKGYYDKPQTKMKIAEKLSADKVILKEFYKSAY
jgi:hypothetical protein